MIYLLYYFIYMQLQFEIFFLLFVSFSNVFDFLLFSEIVFHFNLCAEFAFNSIHLYKWRQNLLSNFIFVDTLFESKTDHLWTHWFYITVFTLLLLDSVAKRLEIIRICNLIYFFFFRPFVCSINQSINQSINRLKCNLQTNSQKCQSYQRVMYLIELSRI